MRLFRGYSTKWFLFCHGAILDPAGAPVYNCICRWVGARWCTDPVTVGGGPAVEAEQPNGNDWAPPVYRRFGGAGSGCGFTEAPDCGGTAARNGRFSSVRATAAGTEAFTCWISVAGAVGTPAVTGSLDCGGTAVAAGPTRTAVFALYLGSDDLHFFFRERGRCLDMGSIVYPSSSESVEWNSSAPSRFALATSRWCPSRWCERNDGPLPVDVSPHFSPLSSTSNRRESFVSLWQASRSDNWHSFRLAQLAWMTSAWFICGAFAGANARKMNPLLVHHHVIQVLRNPRFGSSSTNWIRSRSAASKPAQVVAVRRLSQSRLNSPASWPSSLCAFLFLCSLKWNSQDFILAFASVPNSAQMPARLAPAISVHQPVGSKPVPFSDSFVTASLKSFQNSETVSLFSFSVYIIARDTCFFNSGW